MDSANRIAGIRRAAFIFSLSAANVATNSGARVALIVTALKLGANPFTVGVLMAMQSAVPMLLAIPIGRTIDRLDIRLPLLIGSGGSVLVLLIPTTALSIWALFSVSI